MGFKWLLMLTVLVGLAMVCSSCGNARPRSSGPPPGYPGAHPELWPELTPVTAADAEQEARIEQLLARMSVEDKVGQVIQAEMRWVTPEDVRRYRLGSVLNGGGVGPGGFERARPEEWLTMADAFYEASLETSEGGVAIPVLWGTDAVHGHNNVVGATVFPHNIGLGATRNLELIREIGRITATEVAVTGLDWTFAPTLAVAQDLRWGRTYESFSQDPQIVSACGAAMIEGLQGKVGDDSFLDGEHVIATAKHFLGDGGTAGGVNEGDTRCSEEELRDLHGAGYLSALASGVQTVMVSFSSWHGLKMHNNHELLTTILKQRMGFDGLVVGDWNGHAQIPGCSESSCPAAINAGLDLFMVPQHWKALRKNTISQVRRGEIPESRLDDAVRRILRVKLRAGLFSRGRPSSRPMAGRLEVLGAPEHRAVARRAVRESLVLLKNNGRLLPLDPRCHVLVAGDGADDIGRQCGGWSVTWQGTDTSNDDFPGGQSIWDGIRETVVAAGGTTELAKDGRYAALPDVAVVVIGEKPYAETEGDLESLEYRRQRPRDVALLRRLAKQGIPVVTVLLSGRPLWVNPELNASDAFVAAWLPGSEGGGVADLLFRSPAGEVVYDFSGRLGFAWPASLDPDGGAGEPLYQLGSGLGVHDDRALPQLPE